MRDLFPSYCKRHCCYHASENYTDHICSGFWLSGYMPFFSLLEDRKSRSAGNWCFSLSHVSWEVLNIWRSHLSPGTKSCNTTYCLHWSKDSPSGHSFLFFFLMDNSLLYNYIYTSSRRHGLDCKSSAEKDYVVWNGGEDENQISVGWWEYMESYTSLL